MDKIDIEFRSKRSQRTVSCIGAGILWAMSAGLSHLPLRGFSESVSAIFKCGLYGGRKKRYNPRFSHIGRSSRMSLHLWTLALSGQQKCFYGYGRENRSRKVGNLVSGHILSCGESFISIVAVYHAGDIESRTSFRWDIDIFTSELPSVWHISLGADSGLSSP